MYVGNIVLPTPVFTIYLVVVDYTDTESLKLELQF